MMLFYGLLGEIIRSLKTHEINVVICDFIMKIGEDKAGVTGSFGNQKTISITF